MAKIIKLTPEYLEEVRHDFEASLRGLKIADGKITFTKTFTSIQRKATVYYTETAWQKMQTLIREFDKEVAWHGIAYRGDDPEKDEYTITDILVYPQEVTGATVTTDQTKYQNWLMEHDDEVFNNIRMQGHSHVNMSTSPSGVDTSLYERILDQLDDTMFYIFLIYNKKGDKTYKIYDLAKNVLFETADVTVKILGNGFDMDEFIKDAKSKVLDRPIGVTPYTTYGNGYQGYNKPTTYNTPAPSTPKTPAASDSASKMVPLKPVVQQEQKKDDKKNVIPSYGTENLTSGNRKGKQKNKHSNRPVILGGKQSPAPVNSAFYDDDDIYGYGDPYGAFGWRDGRWY